MQHSCINLTCYTSHSALIEFKFRCHRSKASSVEWQAGSNRQINVPSATAAEVQSRWDGLPSIRVTEERVLAAPLAESNAASVELSPLPLPVAATEIVPFIELEEPQLSIAPGDSSPTLSSPEIMTKEADSRYPVPTFYLDKHSLQPSCQVRLANNIVPAGNLLHSDLFGKAGGDNYQTLDAADVEASVGLLRS